MMRARSLARKAALLAVVISVFLLALPAVAQEEETSTTTTSTTAPAVNLTPAVPIEPPSEAPAQPDWTYRFLIPTGIVLAGLVILVTSIRYFTNVVRKRYRIIEE